MRGVYLLFVLALLMTACSQVPEDVPYAIPADNPDEASVEVQSDSARSAPIDTSVSTFGFEGFGPGKSHEGSFDVWSGTLEFDDSGSVVGAQVEIDSSSVTSTPGLVSHLLGEDFFNSEVYPTIVFDDVVVSGDSASGDLTFLGVTETVTFPIEVVDGVVSADFLLDTSVFGMSYPGVEDSVRIFFSVRA